jgi:hypothetical protein
MFLRYITYSVMNFLAAFTVTHADVTQTINLQSGWNAIYLEVDPADREPSVVFGNASVPPGAIDMVWTYVSPNGAAEFVLDQDELPFEKPGWYVHITSGERQVLSNLYGIRGGSCYLIKANQNISFTVTGTPVYRSVNWEIGRYNLVGFYADPAAPLSFDEFLGLDPQTSDDATIYQLSANGIWTKIVDPDATTVVAGRAYWVYNDGLIKTSGPWELDPTSQNGLDFGNDSTIRRVRVSNKSAFGITNFTAKAASTNLKLNQGYEDNIDSPLWPALNDQVLSIDTGDALDLTIGMLRRPGFDASIDDTITYSGGGMRVRLPLKADATPGLEGLWGGSVAVTHVSYINASGEQANTPLPTQSTFSFKVLIHYDGNGVARLLKEAYVVHEETPAPTELNANAKTRVPVVLDNDQEIPNYVGIKDDNGKLVGYRLSAVTYDFPETSRILSKVGNFGAASSHISVMIPIAEESKTHPMRHRHHPGHDGLDEMFQTRPTQYPDHKKEVWAMTRELKFTFKEDNSLTPLDGVNVLSGDFSEIVQGAYKAPIYVSGQFFLQRISNVATLRQ